MTNYKATVPIYSIQIYHSILICKQQKSSLFTWLVYIYIPLSLLVLKYMAPLYLCLVYIFTKFYLTKL
jgi:hypothetical protein